MNLELTKTRTYTLGELIEALQKCNTSPAANDMPVVIYKPGDDYSSYEMFVDVVQEDGGPEAVIQIPENDESLEDRFIDVARFDGLYYLECMNCPARIQSDIGSEELAKFAVNSGWFVGPNETVMCQKCSGD